MICAPPMSGWDLEKITCDGIEALGFKVVESPLKGTFGNRKNYERYKAEAKENLWQVYLNLLGMGYNLIMEDLI